jgi:hypothetical protein
VGVGVGVITRTVGDLIEELKKHNPKQRIALASYDEEYDTSTIDGVVLGPLEVEASLMQFEEVEDEDQAQTTPDFLEGCLGIAPLRGKEKEIEKKSGHALCLYSEFEKRDFESRKIVLKYSLNDAKRCETRLAARQYNERVMEMHKKNCEFINNGTQAGSGAEKQQRGEEK